MTVMTETLRRFRERTIRQAMKNSKRSLNGDEPVGSCGVSSLVMASWAPGLAAIGSRPACVGETLLATGPRREPRRLGEGLQLHQDLRPAGPVEEPEGAQLREELHSPH